MGDVVEEMQFDPSDEQIMSYFLEKICNFPGWRFLPNDEQLINLLKNKTLHPAFSVHEITDVDVYKYPPWELHALSAIKSEESPMYFFTKLDYRVIKSEESAIKNKNGDRARISVSRVTDAGYWKVTAQNLPIKSQEEEEVIGIRKILTFKPDDQDQELNTDWVMYEYNTIDNVHYKEPVLCRIERKRKPNKKPKSNNKRCRDDGESHHDLLSESRSEDVQSTLSEVEPQSVSGHHLVSNAKNQRKRKPNKKPKPNNERSTTTGDEGESYHDLLSESRSQDVQSTFSEVDTQPVSSQHLVSNDRNHVAQKTSTQISDDRNHVAQKTSTKISNDARNHVAQNTSTEISYARNHVAQNTSAEISDARNSAAQFTLTEISDAQNPVSQDTLPGIKKQSLLWIEQQLLGEFDTLDGCNRLDPNFPSAVLSPIHSEQESSQEQTLQTRPPDFSSSGGIYGENSSATNSETLIEKRMDEDYPAATLPPELNSSWGMYVGGSSDTNTETISEWRMDEDLQQLWQDIAW